MNRFRSSLLFISALSLVVPAGSPAEYYRYIDDEGTVSFVDDKTKVPGRYRSRMEIHQDPDDLSPVREATVGASRTEGEVGSGEKTEDSPEIPVDERSEPEKIAKQDLPETVTTTKVVIVENQVYVPVRLGYLGKEKEALLLLDTGANATVITRAVAEDLGIDQAKPALVRIVGGRSLRARLTHLTSITAGPCRKEKVMALILGETGEVGMGDGLLGMNFLRNFSYRIDFNREEIHWAVK